jgi:putative transposase
MRAYSLDLRQRAIDALARGQTQEAVAERFEISLSSVQRFARQWRERGDLAAKPAPGKARAVPAEMEPDLKELVLWRTDWTLETLADAWQQRTGRRISISALQRNLRWLGLSLKKSAG